jgi:methyl coenzyme M reductase subunit D
MSERKVLNKYYPPDFDPSKLPRAKRSKNHQFTIRLMAPCNMRCKTCGEYIYKGKKFNARKEDVIGETYLGIQIYRFYIKCTKCLREITFKTDPANGDYELEHGGLRNFESIRLAEKQAKEEAAKVAEEEAINPMKLLENRTRDSRQEMAAIEALEDIKEINARHADIEIEQMLNQQREQSKQLELFKKQIEKDEDEAEIREAFGKTLVKIENDDAEVEEMVEDKEEILPLSINTTKPKTTISFSQPINGKRPLPKTSLVMAIKKKPATNNSVPKPSGGLSALVASYDDDDDDDDSS